MSNHYIVDMGFTRASPTITALTIRLTEVLPGRSIPVKPNERAPSAAKASLLVKV